MKFDYKQAKALAAATKPGQRISLGSGISVRMTADRQQKLYVRYKTKTTDTFLPFPVGKDDFTKVANKTQYAQLAAIALTLLNDAADAGKEGGPKKSKDKSQMTVGEAFDLCIEFRRPTWKVRPDGKNTTLNRWKLAKDSTFAPIADLPIAELDIEDVVECLRDRWLTKAPTARKEREIIYAVVDHYLDLTRSDKRNVFTEQAIAVEVGKPLPPKEKVSKEKYVPTTKEIKNFFKHASSDDPAYWGAVLAAVTVSRIGEVNWATRDQFNQKTRLWYKPAWLMKSQKDSVVPLEGQAVKAVQAMMAIEHTKLGWNDETQRWNGELRLNDFNENTVRKFIYAEDGLFTPHKIRDAFSTWVSEKGHDIEVREAIMSHKVADTYNHAKFIERKRSLLKKWVKEIGLD